MEPVRFGVLGTAKIALEKVIPAMQKSQHCRDRGDRLARPGDGREARPRQLGIPEAYGSYEELLADPEIEAIYNPLPNHLHVPLDDRGGRGRQARAVREADRARRRGGASSWSTARDRTGVLIAEAFMVRYHPQWLRARELVRAAAGSASCAPCRCSSRYFNGDPGEHPQHGRHRRRRRSTTSAATRSSPSRFLFGAEPTRVVALIDRDPDVRHRPPGQRPCSISGGRQLTSPCSTQLGALSAHADLRHARAASRSRSRSTRRRTSRAGSSSTTAAALGGGSARDRELRACDQYTLQGDVFARAIRGGTKLPFPLKELGLNMKVLDAVFRSGKSGWFETV